MTRIFKFYKYVMEPVTSVFAISSVPETRRSMDGRSINSTVVINGWGGKLAGGEVHRFGGKGFLFEQEIVEPVWPIYGNRLSLPARTGPSDAVIQTSAWVRVMLQLHSDRLGSKARQSIMLSGIPAPILYVVPTPACRQSNCGSFRGDPCATA